MVPLAIILNYPSRQDHSYPVKIYPRTYHLYAIWNWFPVKANARQMNAGMFKELWQQRKEILTVHEGMLLLPSIAAVRLFSRAGVATPQIVFPGNRILHVARFSLRKKRASRDLLKLVRLTSGVCDMCCGMGGGWGKVWEGDHLQ